LELVQLTNEVLLYGEPRALTQWQRQYDEFGQMIRDPIFSRDPDLSVVGGLLVNHYADLLPLQRKLVEARRNKDAPQVLSILASQLFQDATQLRASANSLKELAGEFARSAYETSKQRQIAIFSVFIGRGPDCQGCQASPLPTGCCHNRADPAVTYSGWDGHLHFLMVLAFIALKSRLSFLKRGVMLE